MSRLRIFVGGVHGVGKGSLCKCLADSLMSEYVSASKLLQWNSKLKFVNNVRGNQEILAELLFSNTQSDFSYIIDGHFALWNKDHACEPVPLKTFVNLNLSAIVLVTCTSEIIQNRLKERDNILYKLEDIIQLQDLEIKQAKYVAEALSIPIIVVDTTEENYTDSLIKKIKIMEPYTRDNILSPMLKTVIIRADYDGLTDLRSFVNRIKSNEEMQKSFGKMVMIPKQNMSVSFKPKDIVDGQLPITENQKSIVYRFYDCKIGNYSKATLDVEPGSITLAVDCQHNYSGSKEYSYFMGVIIEELRAYDQYVKIKRLGVRKIDVQVLLPTETIDKYFNDRYVVAKSWESSPRKTKSILTDLLEIDNIFFNVVQYIDQTNDERVRLIYDVDAFLGGEFLSSTLTSGKTADMLYHDMQDQMFKLFINVASNKYLEYCKLLKEKQNG
jgi:adenylate kinase